MPEPTVSSTTSTDDTQDEAALLSEAIQTAHEEGTVLPVTMDGVVVGKATVVAGGRLSVTLSDSFTNFGKMFTEDYQSYSLAFEDSPNA